jgi:hypothetical protein
VRKPYWALLVLLTLTSTGCQSLLIHKEDSRGLKTAKVAGRVVQGVGTGWLSEAYYAGQRARQ